MKAVEGRVKWYFSSIVTYLMLTLIYSPAVSLVCSFMEICVMVSVVRRGMFPFIVPDPEN